MRLSPLILLALLLTHAAAQTRPQGSIEGNVSRQGSTTPVRRARATLTKRAPRPTTPAAPTSSATIPPVVTDERGRFIFGDLEDGTYTLRIEANGYVAQSYGQRTLEAPAIPIEVRGGQPVRDINVTLMPAATVSGRIRDAGERPIVGVAVQLLRLTYTFDGLRRYESVVATSTNDRGEYRLYWVAPGRYYLIAGRPTTGENPLVRSLSAARGATNSSGNPLPPVSGYSFYPGVPDVANARSIDLQPGAELQTVDLTLNPNPRTFTARGKVIDSRTTQSPAAANIVVATQTPGLSRDGTDGISMAGLGSSPNYNPATGTFEFRGLLPGTYTVTATVPDPGGRGRGAAAIAASGTTSFSISSEDAENIPLTVSPAGTIPGTLRLEGQLDPGNTIDRLRVILTPLGLASARALQSAVAADGTFRLTGVAAGDYRIEVTSTPVRMPGAGGFTKEARFEGLDALNNPLRFSGTTTNGLDIVVASGGGKLSGVLTNARSQPVPGNAVVLIPDRARFRPDIFRTATTDQDGRFSLSAIAPGDYKVLAWESLEPYAYFDPQLLARYETLGRAVRVTETSNEAVDLRIIPVEAER